MESEISCSELCDGFPGQELERRPLHDLCRTTITSSHHSSKTISSLSPALLGVVWTFLSCGILLIAFFLGFTIRCRKNRIVKMSSPNLNIVTLLGSCLTYSSAYLFGIHHQGALAGRSMETLIQVRLSMLCIGTSLVFGPILGKSWRLYKVFTQRVPDKRVIIKDLQLLGLVAALVVADVILLMTWVLTDPIRCLQILSVSMTVTGRDVSCSLTSTHFCASRYPDVWIALVLGCKLKQWKAFEEENQTVRRMAKYFSTPSKSLHTQYGEEQSCHVRGEKNSMERLLTEKNAVIESLQEQVNNAKEKLVRLMSAECTYDPPEGAIPPASSHSKDILAAAPPHSLAAQGSLKCLPDSLSDTTPATQDSQSTSAPASGVQGVKGPVEDTSPSPGQKEKIAASQDFSDHLNLGCSQKPRAEQSQGVERRDQVPMALQQGLTPGGEGSVPQRQGQLENSEGPQARPSRVNSVIREKLQEVLQDLGLGPEAPVPRPPSCPQQPWKSSACCSPQKMPLSKELGFSPYMVRRRGVAQRARSHLPGSVPCSVGRRVNRADSGARTGRNVQDRDSPCLDPQTADSRVARPSSRKPLLLPAPQGKADSPEGSKQCQTEPQGAEGSRAALSHQPSGPGQALCPAAPRRARASPDLPEQRLQRSPVPPGCPSLSPPHSYLDTESSSSDEFFCRCHRPYCEICFQSSSDSSDSGSSDSDPEPAGRLASWEKLWARSKPVVNFKDDLKPTLV
ncbi:probable G-protein coupled receptor 156 isoform X3 [Tursiops truncatus]|uniref:Probable G-protein coupled receptor 156 isoform X2 n=1 Tax=Tursiops truncatus TaxID=9739 RepID=A0A6J3R9Y6_TURTR|nr:probable G-protein coupled receptor 156 isoform X2 [Tursiops truncatus]